MTQRYTHPTALARMTEGLCPECGLLPSAHSVDTLFGATTSNGCMLRRDGVLDRISASIDDQIAEVRGLKEVAIDAEDHEAAGVARDLEKSLLAAKNDLEKRMFR